MKKITIKKKQEIICRVAAQFPSFGGRQTSNYYNPLSIILSDKPPMFAAGVDIESVVQFIIDNL